MLSIKHVCRKERVPQWQLPRTHQEDLSLVSQPPMIFWISMSSGSNNLFPVRPENQQLPTHPKIFSNNICKTGDRYQNERTFRMLTGCMALWKYSGWKLRVTYCKRTNQWYLRRYHSFHLFMCHVRNIASYQNRTSFRSNRAVNPQIRTEVHSTVDLVAWQFIILRDLIRTTTIWRVPRADLATPGNFSS